MYYCFTCKWTNDLMLIYLSVYANRSYFRRSADVLTYRDDTVSKTKMKYNYHHKQNSLYQHTTVTQLRIILPTQYFFRRLQCTFDL